MRTKRPRVILTFPTTTAAMAMEKACMSCGAPGRLIPVPREITAGCGMAWKLTKKEAPEHMPELLDSFEIEYEQIHEL